MGVSDDYGDFSKHPTSVGEYRATRSEQGADLWSPREALIACLRALDRGEIEPDQIAIIVTEDDGEGSTSFHYFQRCKSTFELIGLYQTASKDALERGG